MDVWCLLFCHLNYQVGSLSLINPIVDNKIDFFLANSYICFILYSLSQLSFKWRSNGCLFGLIRVYALCPHPVVRIKPHVCSFLMHQQVTPCVQVPPPWIMWIYLSTHVRGAIMGLSYPWVGIQEKKNLS